MATATHLIGKMPPIASIRASVLLPLVDYLDARTGKTDLLLAGQGILRPQLEDLYAIIPIARYVALFEEAASLLGDPFLGARLGQSFKPSDLGPVGILFSLSPTIRSAFERLARYVDALQGATSSRVFEENGDLVWNYRLLDPALWPRRQESEFTLVASCQLVRSCFSRNWRPLEVHFEHAAPRDAAPLQRILRVPILFGQSGNRLVMAREDADKVYRLEDRSLTTILERHIADLAPEADLSPGLSEKVRAIIGIYLGHKPITVPVIAAELKISARTLQRRLSEEGVSLRQLVRQHRNSLADRHLGVEGNSKTRIAELLGYADSTVLWRARKRWLDQE